jgi:hypothetical protein
MEIFSRLPEYSPRLALYADMLERLDRKRGRFWARRRQLFHTPIGEARHPGEMAVTARNGISGAALFSFEVVVKMFASVMEKLLWKFISEHRKAALGR